ncbi:helix-turn-helix domain-containing protein [Enterobacter wuhouensis]|uniref:helix-turn-helix domain-containing protein n=1 Tax=Enterobacter wuhouensis TaxID=2529381 RepID=UPI003526B8BE
MMNTIEFSDSVFCIGNKIKNSPLSHFSQRKKNQRVDVKRNEEIYFIETGKISFYRVADDLLTISMTAPCVVGVAQMLFQYQTHYIRCDTNCTMWIIDSNDANILFTTENIWMHAFNILASLTKQYFEREYMTLQKSTREIILHHLKFIWEMREEERALTSIYNFILSRNHLSRSSVHKIVSELEIEGKIKTSKGKLIYLQL